MEDRLIPLTQIKDVSDQVQADKKPTLQLVIPVIYNLCTMSKSAKCPINDFKPITQSFILKFEKDLKTRVKDHQGRSHFQTAMAHYLNPAHKGLILKKREGEIDFFKENETNLEAWFQKRYGSADKGSAQSTLSSSASGVSLGIQSKRQFGGFEEFEDDVDSPGDMLGAIKPTYRVEMDQWMSEPRVMGEVDILSYWKENSRRFPHLGAFAR